MITKFAKFDLSTLDLPSGTHTITVKSKADGYLDSKPSNAVTVYVVGGTWVFNERITENYDIDESVQFLSNETSFGRLYFEPVHLLKYDDRIVRDHGIWNNDAYRTINFTENQIVSKDFYEWLTGNASYIVPISGTYYFNEVIDSDIWFNLEEWKSLFYFSSNGIDFIGMGQYDDVGNEPFRYKKSDNTDIWVYYRKAHLWVNENYRIITFSDVQNVAQEVYDWFTKNSRHVINFSVDGVNYQAAEGMTWYEWCNSILNTSSEISCGGLYHTVNYKDGLITLASEKNSVSGDGIIKESAYVYMEVVGGGGSN